ncbi:MAG TPA: 2-succinyl-5-enolpyruvyl-6-hydroxy-3-cyclohexene-1-carboxylate synthase, partial [Thermoanaerobaculia bacterium]|nr:2-succinyl-5-enolpyruvyl-6-hydroxy-3-cyclohexene-1-carboxylate synthase [Thermoanaerobaculia bacterium]
ETTAVQPAGTPAFRKPLVILGGHAQRARDFVLRLNAPVYAEPLSGLREDPALQPLMITSGERMIARGNFDRVIRIGNVPALRFWRDLDETRTELPVTHYSDLPFPGLTRGELHPIDALPDVEPLARDDEFFARDREQAARFAQLLDAEPQSELALLRALDIPQNARVYLGNSLPIREWDLVASREPRGITIEANRGANGIDGQLSTFFGQCDPARENICILGDLTVLYDLNAPWIVPQLDANFRIVILNNRGGRIFERVASLRAMNKQLIVNEHAIRFDAWARMFGIEDRVTELVPDLEATRRVWARYDELWA